MTTAVTKRVAGAITEGTTARVALSGITTAVTKRVTAAASQSITGRVDRGNVTAGFDPWGDSWGAAWGTSWLVILALSALGHAARVSGAITADNTKRVTDAVS